MVTIYSLIYHMMTVTIRLVSRARVQPSRTDSKGSATGPDNYYSPDFGVR